MNIIVVGCDCTGKSTLIELIQKSTGFEVLKGSSFELTGGKTEDELFNTMLDLAKKNNIIYDRFAHCNHVYAPLYNDYAQLKEHHIRQVELALPKDSFIIHLTAKKDVILERFNTRGEDYVDEARITPILEGYDNILQDANVPVFHFDTGQISAEEINQVISFYRGVGVY